MAAQSRSSRSDHCDPGSMEWSDTDPANRRWAMDAVIDEALETGRVVGAVVLVRERGALVYERAAGYRDREAGLPMALDTVFRWASLTKPLVSATALALVERHRLTLEDRVTEFLPGFSPTCPTEHRRRSPCGTC